MAYNSSLWQDDFWILLMQVYQRKPVGMKPVYSRLMVDLALELHIDPKTLHSRMFELRNAATPSLKRLWERYGNSQRRLNRDAEKVRGMAGFANGGEFYHGVEVEESFEKDFRPVPRCKGFTPVALILILDLYFRLTPITMNSDTPEVRELAKLVKAKVEDVVEVMNVYQILDPYLNRNEFMVSPLLAPCQRVWQRYGNGNIEELAALAAQIKEYFK